MGLAEGGHDLAQGNAAVVRGDALVPVGAKAFFVQALDGALGQITVLEAAAGKNDARLAKVLRDCNDGFGEAVMEAGGDARDRDAVVQVGEDGIDHGGPVQEEGGVMRDT